MLIIPLPFGYPLMPAQVTIPAIVGAAQNVGRRFDQLAGWIANPPENAPLAGAVGRAGQVYCDWFGSVQTGVNDLGGPAIGTSGLLCQPYWDSQNYDPPVSTLGPQTGQCPTEYSFTWTVNGNQEQPQFNSQWVGPMSQPVKVPGFTAWFEFTNGNGNVFRAGSQFSTNNGAFTGWVRTDGLPDDCADPDPVLEPGENPPPNPGPFPTGQEPGFDPITGQPFFFVPDIPSPIPGLPDIEPQDPSEEPTAAPAAPQPAGDGIPGDEDAVGAEAGESTGGEEGQDVDFGEPPPNKIWVGCLIQSTVDARLGNIPGTGPQNTVYPLPIANVSLKFSEGRGESKAIRSQWSESIRPSTSLVVEGAFIQSRVGVTSKVFPISATVCKELSCGVD